MQIKQYALLLRTFWMTLQCDSKILFCIDTDLLNLEAKRTPENQQCKFHPSMPIIQLLYRN